MTSDPPVNPHLQQLRDLLSGYRVSQIIVAAAKLGVADHLARAPRTTEELAALTQSHAPSLYRLMRALGGAGMCRQGDDGRWELTPLAEGLRSDVPGSVHGTAVCYGETWWWDSWGRLYDSVKTGETAFNRLFGEPLFDYLGRHPTAERAFNDHMGSFTELIARAFANTYDFSASKVVCDIAGGNGVLLREVLRRHDHLRGMLFEQATVAANAREKLAEANLLDRCELVTGSFFETVPGGADTYVMKNIIHDWEDDLALQLLKNCRRAMSKEARLLLIEVVVPSGNEPSLSKILDMTMLVIVKGIERTAGEYRDLLTQAGFALTRIIDLPANINVIEAVPA